MVTSIRALPSSPLGLSGKADQAVMQSSYLSDMEQVATLSHTLPAGPIRQSASDTENTEVRNELMRIREELEILRDQHAAPPHYEPAVHTT